MLAGERAQGGDPRPDESLLALALALAVRTLAVAMVGSAFWRSPMTSAGSTNAGGASEATTVLIAVAVPTIAA